MSEERVTENGSVAQFKLDIEVSNGIKHAVATLDHNSSGKVEKSQLQAIVANVCQAIKISFVSDDLENYSPESEDLSVSEFLEFLESKLLAKGKKLNPKEMDELSWVVVGQKYDEDPHMLAKKDAFKLWLVFKKLDVSGECRVDVEELCIILEKFVRGIGVQWNENFLTEFAEDGALTFWKFIDCLERKFLIGVDKNVLREGLQELYDFILDEVTKTGFLSKKGHGFLQGTKSRWFVLKPEKMTYYVSSGYREKKGDIILNNEAKVTSIPDKGSTKCRFLVTCGMTKKEFEQIAPDQRTKQAWMTEIQTAIDCFGGQTPLMRDLIARKAKRDEDRARKAEEERKRREQEDLLDQQRKEIDLLKKRKEEIEKYADEERAALDAEIKRREELEELQRNLQQLLEDQKRAREEDEKIRAAKERLLEEERMKREQLEALRLQQQQELQNEKMQKEELMEKQKEQELILEEERKRLQHLEEERMKAEEAAKAAKDKLTAAETAAKNAAEQAKDRVRQLKTSIGLKGTVGPKVDPLVSHRGKGAFTLEEFLNRASEWSGLPLEDEERARSSSSAPEVDELVKASATPAPNQNIPEFLKKAAAWSGLNPETYLEGAEEKKNSPPPKVAAKPSKPTPKETPVDAEGKQASQDGNEAPQEGKELPEASNDVPQEGYEVPQVIESEVTVEKKADDYSVSQEVNGESESTPVDKPHVVADESEVVPTDDKGSEEMVVDNKESEGVVADDKESEGVVVDSEIVKETSAEDNESSQVGDKEGNVEGNSRSEEVDGNILAPQAKDVEKEILLASISNESSSEQSEKESENPEKQSENDEQSQGEEKTVTQTENEEQTVVAVNSENAAEPSQPEETCSEVKSGQGVEETAKVDETEVKSEVNNGEVEVGNGGDVVDPKEREVNDEITKKENGEVKEENGGVKEEIKDDAEDAGENADTPKEPEVNNENMEEVDEQDRLKEEEATKDELENKEENADMPTQEKVVPSENKENIVENGCGESSAENLDNDSALSEKCAKPDLNTSTENVEAMS